MRPEPPLDSLSGTIEPAADELLTPGSGPLLGLVSLGCDKNTVDSERMLAVLVGHGARPVSDLGRAEVILVNTCAFIDAAKEESIEMILRAAELKAEAACRAVVAVGCMVERYREELEPSLPEVDLWLGLRDVDRLVPELRERGLLGDPLVDHPGARLPISERRHVRYLKVSEGCNHGCAFCAIPLWRGRHRSFEPERLVAEARRVEAQGAVEVNLVAQDLAHYGRDLRDGTEIASLLGRLLEQTAIPWFRLLYIYSAGLREPLVELMASEDRVLPYIDMPIQHASDPVLERMRRPERRGTIRRKVAWLRDAIPDLTLRTTVMVGFPGETEKDFRALLDFLEEARFDRLGAFAFSPQDGTRAAEMEELFVPEEVRRERLEELLEVQRAVSAERLAGEVGRVRRAIVDRLDPDPLLEVEGAAEADAVGRTSAQADDVDGETALLLSPEGPRPAPGQIVEVEITAAGDFDLAGRVMRVVRRAPAGGDGPEPPAAGNGRGGARRLPVVTPLGLETAWGK